MHGCAATRYVRTLGRCRAPPCCARPRDVHDLRTVLANSHVASATASYMNVPECSQTLPIRLCEASWRRDRAPACLVASDSHPLQHLSVAIRVLYKTASSVQSVEAMDTGAVKAKHKHLEPVLGNASVNQTAVS